MCIVDHVYMCASVSEPWLQYAYESVFASGDSNEELGIFFKKEWNILIFGDKKAATL